MNTEAFEFLFEGEDKSKILIRKVKKAEIPNMEYSIRSTDLNDPQAKSVLRKVDRRNQKKILSIRESEKSDFKIKETENFIIRKIDGIEEFDKFKAKIHHDGTSSNMYYNMKEPYVPKRRFVQENRSGEIYKKYNDFYYKV